MKEEFRCVIIGKVKRAVRQSMPRISPSIKQKSRKLGVPDLECLFSGHKKTFEGLLEGLVILKSKSQF